MASATMFFGSGFGGIGRAGKGSSKTISVCLPRYLYIDINSRITRIFRVSFVSVVGIFVSVSELDFIG